MISHVIRVKFKVVVLDYGTLEIWLLVISVLISYPFYLHPHWSPCCSLNTLAWCHLRTIACAVSSARNNILI